MPDIDAREALRYAVGREWLKLYGVVALGALLSGFGQLLGVVRFPLTDLFGAAFGLAGTAVGTVAVVGAAYKLLAEGVGAGRADAAGGPDRGTGGTAKGADEAAGSAELSDDDAAAAAEEEGSTATADGASNAGESPSAPVDDGDHS